MVLRCAEGRGGGFGGGGFGDKPNAKGDAEVVLNAMGEALPG